MMCLDDCHTYELLNIPGDRKAGGPTQPLTFYRMDVDGKKDFGTTNEEVLKALIHRIKFLNENWMDGKFKCWQNFEAVLLLEHALYWLNERTKDRVSRGVEGKHEP